MAYVVINALNVPEAMRAHVEQRFSENQKFVAGQPGFLGFQLLRPVEGEERYFVVTQWEDAQSYQAWVDGSYKDAHSKGGAAVSTGSAVMKFDVVEL